MRIGKLGAVFALLLLSSPALAGTAQGQIVELAVRQSDQLHYVEISGPITGRASCASATTYFMIKDENSVAGKSLFAMLMSAYLSGKPVTVHGSGNCTRWLDGEDIEIVNYAA